jgi:hypothetical protein
MRGKYQIRAVVNFVVEADNRAAAHIVAVDALTAAELDGFDLDNLGVGGLITTGERPAPNSLAASAASLVEAWNSPIPPRVVDGTSESTDYLARP